MVWSAPASRAILAFSGEEMVVRTVAPRHFGELDDVLAHRAGAASNQQGGALGGMAERDGMMGSHGWDAETGAGLEAHLIGQFDGLRGRQRDVFGGGAEGAPPLPIPHPDPLADARFRHAIARLVDDTGAVAVRDEARPGDLAGRALARFDVGGIDAGGGELHPHFAGSGLWRLHITDAQHLARRPVTFVISRPHEASRQRTISRRPRREIVLKPKAAPDHC